MFFQTFSELSTACQLTFAYQKCLRMFESTLCACILDRMKVFAFLTLFAFLTFPVQSLFSLVGQFTLLALK